MCILPVFKFIYISFHQVLIICYIHNYTLLFYLNVVYVISVFVSQFCVSPFNFIGLFSNKLLNMMTFSISLITTTLILHTPLLYFLGLICASFSNILNSMVSLFIIIDFSLISYNSKFWRYWDSCALVGVFLGAQHCNDWAQIPVLRSLASTSRSEIFRQWGILSALEGGSPIPVCRKQFSYWKKIITVTQITILMSEEKVAEVLQVFTIKTKEQDSGVFQFFFGPHQFCSERGENDRTRNLGFHLIENIGSLPSPALPFFPKAFLSDRYRPLVDSRLQSLSCRQQGPTSISIDWCFHK